MIIDFHTHWGMAYKQRDGSDPSRWLEVGQQYGVTHSVVLPHEGLLHAGKIRQDHLDMHAACGASAGRMIPFCTVDTWFGDEALAEIRYCINELGFGGIKLHPWVQGLSVSTREMDDVCELAAELDVPILFHDGTPPFSLPSQIALLAQRHPRSKIVLGHTGLLEHWREAIAAMRSAENLWACMCGPPLAAYREIILQCDSHRLLWGSDYGFGIFDPFSYRLRIIDLLELSREVRDRFLWRNACELLQIDPSNPRQPG
jgi:uncharacterized protein